MTTSRVLQDKPINFALYYEGDINLYTIYLDDGYPALPLYLKIFNSSIHQIQLAAPGTDDDRKTTKGCHFYMTFPKGVLGLGDSQTILSDDNWKAFYVVAAPSSSGSPRGGGSSRDTIYFSRNTTQTIEAEDSENHDRSEITLILSNIQAASGVETRSSEVGLYYGGKTAYKAPKASEIADIELADHGYDHTLFIINHYGKKKIPLHAGFAGSNTILNDGQTPNQLQLQITNIQNPKNPRPNLTIGKDSRFIVRFDEGDLTKEWALAEPDKVQGIAVAAVDNTHWEANRDGSGNDWIVTPKKNSDDTLIAGTLDLGNSIDLNITNITSGHPSGQTKLTVRYEEIPDYWDGDLVCIIEKTPLMYRSPLKATANNQTLTAVRIKTNFDDNGKSGVKHVGLAVESGDVGIGLDDPQAKLEVFGEFRVRNKDNATADHDHLSIYTDGTKSYIESYGDEDGLWIKSNVQNKVHIDSDLEVNGTLKATSIVGDGAVVTGMIMMWSGSEDDIPVGWALCNGSNDTPDLRDRFVVGAGSSYNNGNTGGNKNITLTPQQMPRHSHGVSDPGHSHQFNTYHRNSSTDKTDSSLPVYARNTTNQPWTKSSTTGIAIQESGESKPFDNRPPYYALCFIMKVAI